MTFSILFFFGGGQNDKTNKKNAQKRKSSKKITFCIGKLFEILSFEALKNIIQFFSFELLKKKNRKQIS
jgi:hypothetical protein